VISLEIDIYSQFPVGRDAQRPGLHVLVIGEVKSGKMIDDGVEHPIDVHCRVESDGEKAPSLADGQRSQARAV